mgnify:CR=1 FL=1
MNRSTETMQSAFLETIARRLEEQGKLLSEIKESLIYRKAGDGSETPEGLEVLRSLAQGQEVLRQQVDKLLSLILLRRNDAPGITGNVVLHQHHCPKVLWITVGMFLALAVTCSGWYQTSAKLDQYIDSDTKYRFLSLDTADKHMQEKLWITDSLLQAQPALRKKVLEKQAAYRRYLELISRARQIEEEAHALKTGNK